MQILNRGKIVFILLYINILFGDVTTTVDKTVFYDGDKITYQIKATGKDIIFPNIPNIGGFPILGVGTAEQIYVQNGKTSRGKTISYTFTPNRSLQIPSFNLTIDGKKFQTNPILLKKIEPQISTKNDDLILLLETAKENAYVGEAIETTIVFKYKIGITIVDAKIEPFKPNNFWVKELKNEEPREENGYMVYKSSFLIFPQKSGKIKLGNQLLTLALKNINTYDIKQVKIFSNDKTINVTPLPQKLTIQGKYAIKAVVDKTETTTNEPVNLTIKIEGFGNIDDIGEFVLDLPKQVVYSSKPLITGNYVDGKYGGSFSQKISILSNKDFEIPPILFKYFDKTAKKIEVVETTPFFIKVTGEKKVTQKVIENGATKEAVQIKEDDGLVKYLYAFGGMGFGALVTFLLMRKKEEKVREKPFDMSIKKAKTDKELYDLLMPYSQNEGLKNTIKRLEENIYKEGKNEIDKKAIIEILKDETR